MLDNLDVGIPSRYLGPTTQAGKSAQRRAALENMQAGNRDFMSIAKPKSSLEKLEAYFLDLGLSREEIRKACQRALFEALKDG